MHGEGSLISIDQFGSKTRKSDAGERAKEKLSIGMLQCLYQPSLPLWPQHHSPSASLCLHFRV